MTKIRTIPHIVMIAILAAGLINMVGTLWSNTLRANNMHEIVLYPTVYAVIALFVSAMFVDINKLSDTHPKLNFVSTEFIDGYIALGTVIIIIHSLAYIYEQAYVYSYSADPSAAISVEYYEVVNFALIFCCADFILRGFAAVFKVAFGKEETNK